MPSGDSRVHPRPVRDPTGGSAAAPQALHRHHRCSSTSTKPPMVNIIHASTSIGAASSPRRGSSSEPAISSELPSSSPTPNQNRWLRDSSRSVSRDSCRRSLSSGSPGHQQLQPPGTGEMRSPLTVGLTCGGVLHASVRERATLSLVHCWSTAQSGDRHRHASTHLGGSIQRDRLGERQTACGWPWRVTLSGYVSSWPYDGIAHVGVVRSYQNACVDDLVLVGREALGQSAQRFHLPFPRLLSSADGLHLPFPRLLSSLGLRCQCTETRSRL